MFKSEEQKPYYDETYGAYHLQKTALEKFFEGEKQEEIQDQVALIEHLVKVCSSALLSECRSVQVSVGLILSECIEPRLKELRKTIGEL